MKQDNLAIHLDNLQRDDCYRVEKVLKQNEHETTELVYFVGNNGAEQGPFIRKYLASSLGLGSAYETLYNAWRSGIRFKHIPIVFDYFQTGEQSVVIMECVSGETLQEIVYREDPSVPLAVDLFPKICDAILELHEALPTPIIHRDLKPSNIMLAQNSLTLIDFGISRLYNEGASQDTYHFGTKSYAPPEQFGFGQTDVRSDVYSLGMLLYYCLTEETPTSQARDEGFFDSRIPEQFREILVRATSLDPKHRYPNVLAMRTAFTEAAAQIHPLEQDAVVPQISAEGSQKPPEKSLVKRVLSVRLLSRIPRPLGIVWNILIFVALAFLAVVCCMLIAAPQPMYEHIPLYGLIIMYGGVWFFIFGSIAFLVIDKRMFRGVFPALASMALHKQFFLSLLLLFIGCIVIAIASALWL